MNNLLKKINLNSVALYLKYGVISYPDTKAFSAGKKNNFFSGMKIKKNKNKITTLDLYNHINFLIKKIIKSAKRKNNKIVLFLASGLDSRLIYKILYKQCILEDYLENFYTITADINSHNNKYSEYSLIRKRWKIRPHNHIVVKIKYNDFFNEIMCSNMINSQPINGLPIISIKKLYKFCVSTFKKKCVVVTGISDQVFYNTTKKYLDKAKNKKTNIMSSDGIAHGASHYLTKKCSILADKAYKKLKIFPFFETKNSYQEHILKQAYHFRGPKVIAEMLNLAKFYKIKHQAPYMDLKMVGMVLSLEKKLLHNKKAKTPVLNMLNISGGKNSTFPGLKMVTPQREILFNKKKSIYKLIKNSILVKLKICDQKKLYTAYYNYLKQYNKCKNTERFKNFSSYEIWKFISSELYLRNINNKKTI